MLHLICYTYRLYLLLEVEEDLELLVVSFKWREVRRSVAHTERHNN